MSRVKTGRATVEDIAPFNPMNNIAVYIKHIDDICQYGNQICEEIDLPIRLSNRIINAIPKSVLVGNAEICKFITDMTQTGGADGMLFRPQLKTALVTIKSIFDKPLISKTIIGSMQVGKSTTQDALDLAGPIMYLLTGRKYFAMFLGTQSSGNTIQTRDSRKMFKALYEHVLIEAVGGETSMHQYDEMSPPEIAQLKEFASEPSLSTYHSGVLEPARKNPVPFGFDNDDISEISTRAFKTGEALLSNYVQHQRSNKKAAIDLVDALSKSVSDAGFSVIMVIDEVHWGSDTGGVMDKFLKAMYKHFASNESSHIIVGVSATPFATSDISGFERIHHSIGEGYCGPNFYRGEVLDPSVGCITPTVMSFDETGGDFPLLLSAYRDDTSFNKWATKANFDGSWDDYKDYFLDELRALLDEIMFFDDGDADTPIAVCMRAMNNNDESMDLMEALYPTVPKNMAIGNYNVKGRKGGPTSMKRWIRDNPIFRNKSRILMSVTAAARMADAFSTTVVIDGVVKPLRWRYLDLSTKTEMTAALLQGLYGRACGYNKIINGVPPVVMMSPANAQSLNDYHETMGASGTKLLKNVFGADATRRGRGMKNFDLDLELAAKESPIIADAMANAQKRIAVVLEGKTGLQGKQYEAPIWDVFTDDVLTEVERVAKTIYPSLVGKVKLLRPSLTPNKESNYYLAVKPDGTGAFGFRKLLRNRTGGNDTMLRGTRRTKVGEVEGEVDAFARAPQLHVLPTTNGKWEIKEVTFVLTEEIRHAAMASATVLGNGSVFAGFRGIEDLVEAYREGVIVMDDIDALIEAGKLSEAQARQFRAAVIKLGVTPKERKAPRKKVVENV